MVVVVRNRHGRGLLLKSGALEVLGKHGKPRHNNRRPLRLFYDSLMRGGTGRIALRAPSVTPAAASPSATPASHIISGGSSPWLAGALRLGWGAVVSAMLARAEAEGGSTDAGCSR